MSDAFDGVRAQAHAVSVLRRAVAEDRVASGYLFEGPNGVGKERCALALAKTLLGQSAHARIDKGAHPDVRIFRPRDEGARNFPVERLREEVLPYAEFAPFEAKHAFVIFPEADVSFPEHHPEAANALLKTLEEPPDHVKFFFCTTDPEKIPITVLSRCQRFDFAPVEVNSILDRLQFIVDSEGLEAEKEALQLLARRAAGSMRDSQSLLEQLLSFCSGKITVDDVHSMLGTAQSGRLSALSARLGDRDAAGALAAVDSAISEGVDVGQLAEQLLGYFRDMMAALVGCEADFMLHTSANEYAELLEAGQRLGLETNLAVIQILDQSIMRMRHSTHTRTLLEIALVRICQLESLDELAGIVAQLRAGVAANSPRLAATRPAASAPPMPEKKTEKIPDQPAHSPVHESPSIPITSESANSIWKQAIAQIQDMTADYAAFCDRVAISAPNRLVASFKASYTLQKESCEKPERKARIEQALQQVTGQRIHVDFEVRRDEGNAPSRPQPRPSLRQRMRDFEKHPLVKQAIDMFEAEITRIEEPRPE
ncbi:MAG: hypothetical protein KC586_13880 [Myxococcales bacterium]|nr:hypothetical protein [Myxococcales bacterium]